MLKYSVQPYTNEVAELEKQCKQIIEEIANIVGTKESNYGLALSSYWNL